MKFQKLHYILLFGQNYGNNQMQIKVSIFKDKASHNASEGVTDLFFWYCVVQPRVTYFHYEMYDILIKNYKVIKKNETCTDKLFSISMIWI